MTTTPSLEDGGRLGPMAVELVERLALFWWQFVASLARALLTLFLCVLTVMWKLAF
jgi:hypothetical protein